MAAAAPMIISLVASTILSKMMEKDAPVAPAAPTPAASPLMPMTDDQAAEAAKKKAIADQIQTRGRASTILTQESDASGSKLGG